MHLAKLKVAPSEKLLAQQAKRPALPATNGYDLSIVIDMDELTADQRAILIECDQRTDKTGMTVGIIGDEDGPAYEWDAMPTVEQWLAAASKFRQPI